MMCLDLANHELSAQGSVWVRKHRIRDSCGLPKVQDGSGTRFQQIGGAASHVHDHD